MLVATGEILLLKEAQQMATVPLLMRLGMSELGQGKPAEIELTEHERLPFVVEVMAGAVLHTSTRLTEVNRETTDDN